MPIRTLIFSCFFLWTLSGFAQVHKLEAESPSVEPSHQEDTATVNLLLDMSGALIFDDPKQATTHAQKALSVAKKLNYHIGVIDAYGILGNIWTSQGNLKEAVSVYQLSLEHSQIHKDTQGIVFAMVDLGNIKIDQNQLAEAMNYFWEALRLRDRVNCKCTKGNIYNSIAIVYSLIDSLEQSRNYYERALEEYKKEEDELSVASAINNLGDYHARKGEYKVAEDYFLQNLQLYERIGDSETGFYAYLNLGMIATKIKNYISAREYLEKAAKLMAQNQSRYYQTILDYEWGALFLAMGEEEKAKAYLEDVYQLSEEIGSKELMRESATLLYELAEKQADYKAAYTYLNASKQLTDSLVTFAINGKMDFYKQAYEKEKVAAAEQLALQQSITAKARKKYLSLLAIAAGLGLLGYLLFFVYRQRLRFMATQREKERLADQLNIKNKELTSKVMFLARKNELIRNISDKLLQHQRNMNVANRKVTQGIINELKAGENDDIWKEFEIRFQEVHRVFYQNLNEQFPELSPTEKRLCAFLRLNMTTKDIANLTYQSTGSIEVARARLRKKLGISNTSTNLHKFLSKLGKPELT